MPCQAIYDEMMSLRLDGMLATQDERRLDEHIADCADCSRLWAAMKEADSLLWVSAAQPLAVPVNFEANVMVRIGAQRSAVAATVTSAMMAAPVPATARLPEEQWFPQIDMLHEWQSRVSTYVRGVVTVGLSIAAAAGLVFALMVSGVIQVGGSLAPVVDVTRTFIQAVDTWLGSVFTGVGPGLVTVVAIVVGLLVLAGWQVITGYHRSVVEQRGVTGRLDTGYLEAVP